ncbi:MAG: hypothetical protein OXI20_02870 [Rhodospirillales bacterium]|nr:hypothetical protein [Rhodospirillales bacterium]
MRYPAACGLALAGVLSLAACGGSGTLDTQDSHFAVTPAEIRELTGLSAPAETGAAQVARQAEIAARADSLILSTTHVEVARPDRSLAFRELAACSGPRCELLEPVTGETDTVSLDTLESASGDAEAIGSAHGVTLTSESVHDMGADVFSLGAWMEHGSFALITQRAIREDAEIDLVYAIALGDLTGRPPAGSATWLGIMVGTPVAGDDEGDRLVGTAALNYDMDAGGLDAAFSGIRNIDRGAAHSTETVIFSDLTIEPDGTFARGQSGARIQGGFYGPGHAEAAGIFELSDIVGAFGAKRQ